MGWDRKPRWARERSAARTGRQDPPYSGWVGGSIIGFISTGFLPTLTVFLVFFLGGAFNCFFFPGMVCMPPLWLLYLATF